MTLWEPTSVTEESDPWTHAHQEGPEVCRCLLRHWVSVVWNQGCSLVVTKCSSSTKGGTTELLYVAFQVFKWSSAHSVKTLSSSPLKTHARLSLVNDMAQPAPFHVTRNLMFLLKLFTLILKN